MRKLTIILLCISILTITSTSIADTYIPLNISMEKALELVASPSLMKQIENIHNLPRFLYQEKFLTIEIIGNPENISTADIILLRSHDKEMFYRDLMRLLVFIHNFDPEYWYGNEKLRIIVQTITQAVEDKQAKYIYQKNIRYKFKTDGGTVLVTISHKDNITKQDQK